MKNTARIAVAAAFAICFASPVGAQETATRVVERTDGGVEVVLPDGDVQVLEPGVVNTLQSGLASVSERAGRTGGTRAATGTQTAESQTATGDETSAAADPEAGSGPAAEQAESADAEVEYGTSQPDYKVSLGNELTYSAAARAGDASAIADGGQETTVQGGTAQGIAAAAPAQGDPSASGEQTLEGLAELVEDTVAELDESAASSPTNAPGN